MIICIPVDFNLLLASMKKFTWPRPSHCPRCNNPKLWGHGFVDACFDGIDAAVPLKRYRCCNCRCIIKLRPVGYFKRFQAPIETIRTGIDSMVSTGKTLCNISRQRQRHWLVALKKKAAAVFGLGADLKAAFEELIDLGIIPVSRSI